jgi:hypothetical protein
LIVIVIVLLYYWDLQYSLPLKRERERGRKTFKQLFVELQNIATLSE